MILERRGYQLLSTGDENSLLATSGSTFMETIQKTRL
jgi:hypothetical protein